MQKIGGLSAFFLATSYLVGFIVFFSILGESGSLSPLSEVVFLVENQLTLYLTILLLYVLSGFSLLLLAQALYERLSFGFLHLRQLSAVIGFMWASIVVCAGMIYLTGMDTVILLYDIDPALASSVWLAVGIVFEGLGGGTELVGGVWCVLISCVAFRHAQLPMGLNLLGMIIGLAGVLTIVPALEDLTIVFGVGQIPWFVWIGIILIRAPKATAA